MKNQMLVNINTMKGSAHVRTASCKVLSDQREYSGVAASSAEFGLIMPEAFVRGIRHIGYKSNAEAIAELVDNSIQAYAQRIDLVLGYPDGQNTGRPCQIALIDDGHGMGRDMLRFAIMWGGTHRENDRAGLGRFGYGLPCATVSMGRRFTVYSKVNSRPVHAVSLDLDLLDTGAYNSDPSGLAAVPTAQPATLPRFVREAIARKHPTGWRSGTVVLIDKLDRLDWVTAGGLRRNLVRHFGVAYHKLLAETAIHIDGEEVQPIDPLFLSPGAKFHSLDEDRANAIEPVRVSIALGDGLAGEVVLRYAWLPPTFGATDKSRDAIGINANARFPVLKQYHGMVFSRNGRVIDVQTRTPWTTFINNDRYIRVEIEFSASLDEAFGVTTSKQQVSVTPEMWDRLQAAGLSKAIEHLRAKVRAAKIERQRTRDDGGAVQFTIGQGRRCTIAAEPAPSISEIACRLPADRAETVHAALETADPTVALTALLARIERRISAGNSNVAGEYDRLLRGWTRELARIREGATDGRA